jgi:hypothetical protein
MMPKKSTNAICETLKKLGMGLGFDVDGGYRNLGTMLFPPDSRPINITGGQLFSESIREQYKRSDPGREKYFALIEMLNSGARSVTVAGRKVTVLLCGENNLVEVKEAKHGTSPYAPQWRFPGMASRRLGGILFNPIHTRMGNGGKLAERFSFLTSPDGGGFKYAIALANCLSDVTGRWPKGGFALYSEGCEVAVPVATEISNRNGSSSCIAYGFHL